MGFGSFLKKPLQMHAKVAKAGLKAAAPPKGTIAGGILRKEPGAIGNALKTPPKRSGSPMGPLVAGAMARKNPNTGVAPPTMTNGQGNMPPPKTMGTGGNDPASPGDPPRYAEGGRVGGAKQKGATVPKGTIKRGTFAKGKQPNGAMKGKKC